MTRKELIKDLENTIEVTKNYLEVLNDMIKVCDNDENYLNHLKRMLAYNEGFLVSRTNDLAQIKSLKI